MRQVGPFGNDPEAFDHPHRRTFDRRITGFRKMIPVRPIRAHPFVEGDMNHASLSDSSGPPESASQKRSARRYLPTVARILMGLPLIVFGLNGFLNFVPPPEAPLPEPAMAFSTALVETGYMMQLIGLTQLVVGILLLINRFVPLALLLFAPFIVNSLAFHLFLEHSGLIPALVFFVLTLYLAWTCREAFRPILRARFP